MTQPQAQTEFLRCRDARAFSVLGASAKASNQHGCTYRFPDGSWLSVSHTSNALQWGPKHGTVAGQDKLWKDRGGGRMSRSRLAQQVPDYAMVCGLLYRLVSAVDALVLQLGDRAADYDMNTLHDTIQEARSWQR